VTPIYKFVSDRRSDTRRIRERYRRVRRDRVRFTDVLIESLSELRHVRGIRRLVELPVSIGVRELVSGSSSSRGKTAKFARLVFDRSNIRKKRKTNSTTRTRP